MRPNKGFWFGLKTCDVEIWWVSLSNDRELFSLYLVDVLSEGVPTGRGGSAVVLSKADLPTL